MVFLCYTITLFIKVKLKGVSFGTRNSERKRCKCRKGFKIALEKFVKKYILK